MAIYYILLSLELNVLLFVLCVFIKIDCNIVPAGRAILNDDINISFLILNDYRILSKKPEEIETGIMKYQWHVVDQLARSLNQKSYVLCSGTEALNTLITIKNILSMNSN